MASSNFTVVYDACVLYPVMLRDVLLTLATKHLFRAKWTEDIHDEWIAAVSTSNPSIDRSKLSRVRTLMDRAVPDALIERSKYVDLVPTLLLPDPKDRHVLAAAIVSGAEQIVTFNLADFPAAALSHYEVAAIHPDDFVFSLLDLDTERVCAALVEVQERLKAPPIELDGILASPANRGLTKSAARLRSALDI